ncbi:MAG: hypothetical protein MUC43_07365 [Pirellula sp.]|nr:hypothetical protein [Pirellula sp.]
MAISSNLHGFVVAADPLLELRSVTRTPLTRAVSGGLVSVRALVLNRSDEKVKMRLSGRVDGFTDQEQVRDIEIAPRSECHFDMLIRVPLEIKGKDRLDIVVDALQERSGQFYQLEVDGKPMSQSLPLSLDTSPVFPAMVVDPFPPNKPFWHWPPAESFYPYEHVKATCVDSGLSIRTANFDVYPLPISYLGWNAIDWLVIGESETLQDASTVETIKRFVQSGGVLWIMLDKVPTDQVRPLLSGRQLCETIDETELTNFVVDVVSGTSSIAEADRIVSVDTPVKMKRVAIEGAEVTHRVGDWPAAFRMRSGYGHIYFSTLGSQAWLKARTGTKPFDSSMTSDFQNQLWAIDWAREVSNIRRFQPFSKDETNYAVELIGSPVPPRSWIAAILSGFCLLIIAIGLWRLKAGDLKQIGYVVPCVSGLIATGIIVGSAWFRRDIEQTDSRLQMIEVSDDGNNAYAREHGAIYQTEASDMKLVGRIDGSGTPDSSVTSGIKTLAADDIMSWSMQNSAWPPGIWKFSTSGIVETSSMRATGRLTETGLEIEPPPALDLSDVIVNFTPGNRMIAAKNGKNFVADGSINASGDRWFVDTLVTNEQTRRASVYRDYFKVKEREIRMPRRLLGWSSRWQELPQWNRDDLKTTGSAMVSIPIQLAPPAPNQTILIPHGLITVQNSKDSVSSSTVFDQLRGEWINESTYASDIDLEFLLPTEVLPFSADKIDIELDIRAPRRTATISHLSNGKSVELGKVDNPSVPWRFSVTDESVLKDCADGVIRLKLTVSERNDKSADAGSVSLMSWQVSHLHLSFQGRVVTDSDLAAEVVGAP